eukprot:1398712-Alexandrium_andersonii.AAC.1
MQMHWLDDLGAVLNQKPLREINRPPFDVDLHLRLSFEDAHLQLLVGTRRLHLPDEPQPVDVTLSPTDDPGAVRDELPMARGELDAPPPPEPQARPAAAGPPPKMPPTAAQVQEYAARQAAERASSVPSAQPRTETGGLNGRWRHRVAPPKATPMVDLGPLPKPPPEPASRKRGLTGEEGAVAPKRPAVGGSADADVAMTDAGGAEPQFKWYPAATQSEMA